MKTHPPSLKKLEYSNVLIYAFAAANVNYLSRLRVDQEKFKEFAKCLRDVSKLYDDMQVRSIK